MEILTCYKALLHVQDTLSRNGQGEIGGVAVSMTFPAGVRHYSQALLVFTAAANTLSIRHRVNGYEH
jgi:hypothetical protein